MADPLVDTGTVSVKQDLGSTLEDCVRALAAQLSGTGRLPDADAFVADVLAREAQGSTGLPGGVALPHARSAGVSVPTVAIASLPAAIPEGGHDVDLVFLLAVPGDQSDRYLALLRQVTTAVVKPGFRADCRAATTPEALAKLANEGFGSR
jgi:mannitol/fructose-specific phosphotransferase system IIA component (Ntr-type)